jgi:predicted HAD superfamily phosphohydrolase YqeG
MMIARIIYALRACWRYRSELMQFISDPSLQINKVLDLTPHDLFGHDVRGLILDFDGVLAPHAALQPNQKVISWLEAFAREFAPYKIYVLSNKPTRERLEYFTKHFPNISMVIAKRKKPYPDGLLQIIKISALDAKQLMLVDDRLATGIVAAVSVGVQGCWVTNPYVDLKTNPVRESFFIGLRFLEKVMIKLMR